MHVVSVVVGLILVLSVMADMTNTLVATTTSRAPWWLTFRLYRRSWAIIRLVAMRSGNEQRREKFLSVFAPTSVLLLLCVWVSQQILGFAMIWWGLGGVDGLGSFVDSIYYSGVVYFTLGFGELVPVDVVPRVGALVEALSGVIMTALVIGYLPALYGAYSERERKLMTLDDGTEGQISPNSLILARAPDRDPAEMFLFFSGWENWVSGVMETHRTFPMLSLFRSQQAGQSWITALGVVTDAALWCQVMPGAQDREPYWLIRRSSHLIQQLTEGADLSDYEAQFNAASEGVSGVFEEMYRELEAAGFDLLPLNEAWEIAITLRRTYGAGLEYLIDQLMAPRGFWGHAIGHKAGKCILA